MAWMTNLNVGPVPSDRLKNLYLYSRMAYSALSPVVHGDIARSIKKRRRLC